MHRKNLHGRGLLRKEIPKPQNKSIGKKASSPIFIGRAFTMEELQALLSSLTSGDAMMEISAVAVFSKSVCSTIPKNDADIFETNASEISVSETQLVELVAAAIIKNEGQMLKTFEKNGASVALNFITFASFIPPEIQQKAESALRRLHISKQTRVVPKQLIHEDNYLQEAVENLIAKLDNKNTEVQISAATEFIKEYPRIIPTISKMPLLSVTEVTIKAVEIIKQNSEAILSQLAEQKMVPELIFISSLQQVPEGIRIRAIEIINESNQELQTSHSPAKVNVNASNSESEKSHMEIETTEFKYIQKIYPSSKDYTPFELRALLDGLGSVERVRVVATAIEFLKNYDIIVKKIAETPLLTVTEVTAKAVKATENNLDIILKELARRREINALNFLAHSRKFSLHVNKKAESVIELLAKIFNADDHNQQLEKDPEESESGEDQ
ncbi:hypothetical protein KKG55_03610 [Candidatus Micrarchaeota archaeon]|nr:hypothetical protein [Candidatus Micrarchaeota archaeon]MBU1886796.1 hypothetical protein [Candidatus Micrarchaeota archaeon]